MRIRIITIGSQGDVRPYVAFGKGLKSAGHDVRIATHARFESLARANGLDFAPVAGDPREVADNRHMRGLFENGRNLFRWWRTLKEVDAPLMRQRLQDCWEACQDAEVIVVSVLPCLFGYAIAEKLGVPLVRAFYFPTSPTASYPADFVPKWLPISSRLNLASYKGQRQVLWQVARPWMAGACRDILGLSTLPRSEPFGDLDAQQQLVLYCWSPSVSPPPPDWGPWIHVTGYWFLDESKEWSPPPNLAAFVDDGPRPVCIGFGSMSNRDPVEVIQTVQQALALTGHRGVVLTERNNTIPDQLPTGIFAAVRVPHEWLFSRLAAVVHHGGAGTTARGLQAGVPTVVIPFFLDQFYWAKRIFELGAGPRPIPHKSLTAEALAQALWVATTDPDIRKSAALLSTQIRAEDGVARAVSVFERHMKVTPRHSDMPVGESGLLSV